MVIPVCSLARDKFSPNLEQQGVAKSGVEINAGSPHPVAVAESTHGDVPRTEDVLAVEIGEDQQRAEHKQHLENQLESNNRRNRQVRKRSILASLIVMIAAASAEMDAAVLMV